MSYVERISPGRPEWKTYIASHRHRYQFASGFVRGARVLDAGCGVGYGSRMLADAGAREIVAVDISDSALDQARQHFSDSRIRYLKDDCETLSQIKDCFDAVVALESLEHLQRPASFLKRVTQVMLPDGVFVCSVPNSLVFLPAEDGRPKNPFHVHEYKPEELRDFLGQYFSTVTLLAQHFTAAYVLAKQSALLWANPFFRLGSLLQGLRGHSVRWSPPAVDCTEADYVMRQDDLGSAEVLVAVCRGAISLGKAVQHEIESDNSSLICKG